MSRRRRVRRGRREGRNYVYKERKEGRKVAMQAATSARVGMRPLSCDRVLGAKATNFARILWILNALHLALFRTTASPSTPPSSASPPLPTFLSSDAAASRSHGETW